MKTFTDNLYNHMADMLKQTSLTADHVIQVAEQSYNVVEATLKELKAFILEYDFADSDEEIFFFKEVKPLFQRELYYHLHLLDFESRKPVSDRDTMYNYHTHTLFTISSFFERNQVLYTYYRLGKTDYDHQYFLRQSECKTLIPEYSLDFDSRFSTPYSIKLAKLQAFELLQDHINASIHLLETGQVQRKDKQQDVQWSDKDVWLLEVITAIYVNRSVNNGNISFQKLVDVIGNLFNKDLRNFHRTLQNMRIRKKDRTPYLRMCIEKVEAYMDEVDLRA